MLQQWHRPELGAVWTARIRPQTQACGNPRALNTPLFQRFHRSSPFLPGPFLRGRLEIHLRAGANEMSTSNLFRTTDTIHGSLKMQVLASDARLGLMDIEGNDEEAGNKSVLTPSGRVFSSCALHT